MNTEQTVIKIAHVQKSFGGTKALDNISLEIHSGRIIGLLGSNGSGKSTLIRHLIGLSLPDSGECLTFDTPAKDLGPKELARIGYVHQEGELPEWMTTQQLIRYVAAYYPTWNHELEERYVQEFELDLSSRVGNLSPGQRQKLAILLAIGFEPELLILDEPAAAMDPIARRRFLDLLLEIIQNTGRTILISSHILSDVEQIIDHVIIMDRGLILRDCSLDDLNAEYRKLRITALHGPLPDPLPVNGAIRKEVSDDQAIVLIHQPDEALLNRIKDEEDFRIEELPMNLEERYRVIVEQK